MGITPFSKTILIGLVLVKALPAFAENSFPQCDRYREISWFGELDCKKVPVHKEALEFIPEENAVVFKIGKDIPLISRSWKNEFRDSIRPSIGSEYFYHLETKIYKQSIPKRKKSIVIAQWHDRKIGYKNFTENVKARANRSRPPLTVRIIDHQLCIILWNDKIFDQRDGLGNGRILYRQDINFDSWHRFDVQVKWAADESGYLKFYIDGVEVIHYEGAIGYKLDRVGPYFKFGFYTVHAFENFGYMSIAHRNYHRLELDYSNPIK